MDLNELALANTKQIPTLRLTRDHHEFWNGQGYPQGLAGEDIHIYCRMTAIADAYDTLRSKRNCNGEMSVTAAIETIEKKKRPAI
jgi:HD-GYP domain-containing protein (c-di-GMP phosphodiesterase class II)